MKMVSGEIWKTSSITKFFWHSLPKNYAAFLKMAGIALIHHNMFNWWLRTRKCYFLHYISFIALISKELQYVAFLKMAGIVLQHQDVFNWWFGTQKHYFLTYKNFIALLFKKNHDALLKLAEMTLNYQSIFN